MHPLMQSFHAMLLHILHAAGPPPVRAAVGSLAELHCMLRPLQITHLPCFGCHLCTRLSKLASACHSCICHLPRDAQPGRHVGDLRLQPRDVCVLHA